MSFTSHYFQIINECNKAEKWLIEKSQQQDAMPKNMDPVLWTSDIQGRKEDLDAYYSCAFFLSAFHNFASYILFHLFRTEDTESESGSTGSNFS